MQSTDKGLSACSEKRREYILLLVTVLNSPSSVNTFILQDSSPVFGSVTVTGQSLLLQRLRTLARPRLSQFLLNRLKSRIRILQFTLRIQTPALFEKDRSESRSPTKLRRKRKKEKGGMKGKGVYGVTDPRNLSISALGMHWPIRELCKLTSALVLSHERPKAWSK